MKYLLFIAAAILDFALTSTEKAQAGPNDPPRTVIVQDILVEESAARSLQISFDLPPPDTEPQLAQTVFSQSNETILASLISSAFADFGVNIFVHFVKNGNQLDLKINTTGAIGRVESFLGRFIFYEEKVLKAISNMFALKFNNYFFIHVSPKGKLLLSDSKFNTAPLTPKAEAVSSVEVPVTPQPPSYERKLRLPIQSLPVPIRGSCSGGTNSATANCEEYCRIVKEVCANPFFGGPGTTIFYCE